MAMEWTREKTLALIQEYRKRRGLWDMTHEDYRKKDVKQKLLVEVSEALGGNIPIMEIEKKFHTLRTQYHREINRMKRKEPYNSKWFGFKYLQFLSSPKACRSIKGRIKAEITEEGTVTTKYIIREALQTGHDTSMGSANENEEFLTLPRRSNTITYETVPASTGTSTASSRSHELEKLIEETTKDVEEIVEAKPKMTMKELSVPMEHHHHHHGQQHHELQISNVESEHHQELHHIEDVDENMEAMAMQHQVTSDEELNYQTNSTDHAVSAVVSTVNAGHTQSSTTTVHTIPARIIKIQRRDTHHDATDYYEQQQQTHHAQQQQQQHHQHHHHQHLQQQHHIQTVSPSAGSAGGSSIAATKRVYYDPSTHHTTTILTTTPPQPQTGVSLINNSTQSVNSSPTNSKIHLRNSLAAAAASSSGINPSSSPLNNSALNTQTTTNNSSALRDEFTTYGEYVANEMREIKSREILLTLKHKINTALFEANMQELQK